MNIIQPQFLSDALKLICDKIGGPNPNLSYYAFKDRLKEANYVNTDFADITDQALIFAKKLVKLGLLAPEAVKNQEIIRTLESPFFATGNNVITQLKAIEFFMEPVCFYDSQNSVEEDFEANQFFHNQEIDDKIIDLKCSGIITAPSKLPSFVHSDYLSHFKQDYLKYFYESYSAEELIFKNEVFDALLKKARDFAGSKNFDIKLFVDTFTAIWRKYFESTTQVSFTNLFSNEYVKVLSKPSTRFIPIYKKMHNIKLTYYPVNNLDNNESIRNNMYINITFTKDSTEYDFSAKRVFGKYFVTSPNQSSPLSNVMNIVGINKLVLEDGKVLFQLMFKVRRQDLPQSLMVDMYGNIFDEESNLILTKLGMTLSKISINYYTSNTLTINRQGCKKSKEEFVMIPEYNYIPFQRQ